MHSQLVEPNVLEVLGRRGLGVLCLLLGEVQLLNGLHLKVLLGLCVDHRVDLVLEQDGLNCEQGFLSVGLGDVEFVNVMALVMGVEEGHRDEGFVGTIEASVDDVSLRSL